MHTGVPNPLATPGTLRMALLGFGLIGCTAGCHGGNTADVAELLTEHRVPGAAARRPHSSTSPTAMTVSYSGHAERRQANPRTPKDNLIADNPASERFFQLAAWQDTQPPAPTEDAPDAQSMADLQKKLNNPLSSVWALFFQNDVSFLKGTPSSAYRASSTLTFQPVLPFEINDEWTWLNRPVFPVVMTSPTFSTGGWDRDGGIGDIGLLSVLAKKTGNLTLGLGPSLFFPTASDDSLGSGKYQFGPAGVVVYQHDNWTLGCIAQQWWGFGGDSGRTDTNSMNLQYFIWRTLPNHWEIGAAPNILIDWKEDSENFLTLPIGLGARKMIKIGKVPVKLGVEVQWMVVHPDDFGQRWNIRLYFIPVIPNPFEKR